MFSDLSQSEADRILATEKRFARPAPVVSLNFGHDEHHDLVLVDDPDVRLRLHINRKSKNPRKASFHLRVLPDTDLCRLDMHGAPHTNPDGAKVPTPHLHLYREGDGLLWAYPAPEELATLMDDIFLAFQGFMALMKVPQAANLQRRLGGL